MAPASLETVRIEALFVSDVQYSDALTTDVVRDAVLGSVRRYGPRGCSALVAAEFDQRPDAAVPRMSWVRSAIRVLYPVPRWSPPRRPSPSPLAA
jgi:hypothetical protein